MKNKYFFSKKIQIMKLKKLKVNKLFKRNKIKNKMGFKKIILIKYKILLMNSLII